MSRRFTWQNDIVSAYNADSGAVQSSCKCRRVWSEQRALCVLTVLYFVLWLACFQSRTRQPDMAGYYAYAQSLVIDGDLSIYEQLEHWKVVPQFRQMTALGQARDYFAVGSAVLWLPFVACAQLLALIGKAAGLGWRSDGQGPIYVYAINLASAIYGYLALVLAHRTTRRFVREAVALSATLAVFLLSPLWHYALFDGSLSHAADAFAVALLLHHLVLPNWGGTRPARHWAIAGALAGLCVLVRWQNALLVALIALALLVSLLASRGRRSAAWLALASFACAALLAFAPQMLVWWVQFGQPLYVPQGAQFFRARPLLFEVLFSAQHGLYSWSPLIALATLAGLPLLALRARGLALVLAACFAFQVYVNASVLDVWGGACCGARRFVGCSALFVLALAAFYQRAPRWLSVLLTAACALWSLPIWRACELGTLDPMLFAEWDGVFAGVARAAAVGFSLASRPWTQLEALRGAGWLALPAALAVLGAWLAAMIAALALRPSQATAFRSCATASLVIVALFALAAGRSQPAPAPARLHGADAMIDFGWYANARFDHDPFRPVLEAPASFRELPVGIVPWHGVPFRFREPVGGARAAPSLASTCPPARTQLSLALDPAPTHAIHIALTALVWARPGEAVAVVRLEHADGSRSERVLHAAQDVWNILGAVPPDRWVAWGGLAFVQGFTMVVDRPVRRMTIESSPLQGNCLSIFAITRERVPHQFEPLDISPIANADYGRDPFAPWSVLNHFPSLPPGRLEALGTSFWLLDPLRSHSGGSTITSAYAPFRQRIPLLARHSRGLALLLDGGLLPDRDVALVRATVEYDRGPDAAFELRAQRDVRNYYDAAAPPIAFAGPPPQDLTLRRWPLDPTRTPRFLWLEGLHSADHDGVRAGVALFALTQQLANPSAR